MNKDERALYDAAQALIKAGEDPGKGTEEWNTALTEYYKHIGTAVTELKGKE